MSKQIPSYLKLVTETPPPARRVDEDLAPLVAVCEAFRQTTGYTLDYRAAESSERNLLWSAPVNPGVGTTPGLLRLHDDEAAGIGEARCVDVTAVKSLAVAIDGLWGELLATRRALWSREADLATGVPVIEHGNEAKQMAARLDAILRSGAQAVDCQAAALYLLDDATSELKLRAAWGLPKRRLLDDPRPLADQLADLEAMLGHAVVLSDPAMFGLWRVPEACGAAVCVPVSTPTIPLGTLWVYSHESRDFTDQQTNLIEMVAGRISADLEREAMMQATVAERERTKANFDGSE